MNPHSKRRRLVWMRPAGATLYRDVNRMRIRAPGVPVFRSFGSSNTLVLRDGQSRQYTAAADRVTGESIRVDVALTVLD